MCSQIVFIMKHMLMMIAVATMCSVAASADDKPIAFEKLPYAARQFVKTNFPDAEVLCIVQDDDLIRPDYTVMLDGGVEIDFCHSGALEKIESEESGIPEGIVPVQIAGHVKSRYPGAVILEYEVDRKGYEVKLSNGKELKFNRGFHLLKVDD